MIEIRTPAQKYLRELLSKQDVPGTGIRVFVTRPGTVHAETCLAYCSPGEQEDDDEKIDYEGFAAWLDKRSFPYLEEAVIDFQKDKMGGQLTIKAPNSRVSKVDENSSLEDRINYVLHNEINPSLASHGGVVSLLEVVEEDQDKIAVLKFGGGCQGCSAVDITLKNGVEESLLRQLPELSSIRDATDHNFKANAYYR